MRQSLFIVALLAGCGRDVVLGKAGEIRAR